MRLMLRASCTLTPHHIAQPHTALLRRLYGVIGVFVPLAQGGEKTESASVNGHWSFLFANAFFANRKP